MSKKKQKEDKKSLEIHWLGEPEAHDYPAAASYLCLIYPEKTVDLIIEKLKNEPTKVYKSKDIFRASQLSLLGVSNSHVKKNINKIKEGKSLSPLLLVKDKAHGKVIIADGYHRMCCVYGFNEDALIPCRIVSI